MRKALASILLELLIFIVTGPLASVWADAEGQAVVLEETPSERAIIDAQIEADQKARKQKEIEALREAAADTTEYTLSPTSVELVVEMDPNGYGFRTRNHRMVLSADIDLVLRGRGMLHYDYRFFRYFSFGMLAGVDWSDVSLYSRFRQHLATPTPWQFAVLGGVAGKCRLTEWYMRSSFFLEPSLLFGYMWQKLATQSSQHWRLRPGLFAGLETVFDSGLAVLTRLGVEAPFDFGAPNAYKEVVEPLFLISFGFAM